MELFERKTAFGKDVFRQLLWQEAERRELEDGWALTLPWKYFGEDGTLTVYFRAGRREGEYEISDGGATMKILRRKLGSLAPYENKIKKIAYDSGMHELRGGGALSHEYCAASVYDHIHRFSCFTRMVAALSNLDIAPPYGDDRHSPWLEGDARNG